MYEYRFPLQLIKDIFELFKFQTKKALRYTSAWDLDYKKKNEHILWILTVFYLENVHLKGQLFVYSLKLKEKK